MSIHTATDSSAHGTLPSAWKYTGLQSPSIEGISIPSLVTPSSAVPTLPQPGQPLPAFTDAQRVQGIELRSRSVKGNRAQNSSSSARSGYAQDIDDGSGAEAESDDGQLIDGDSQTDEDEVGESDSEDALNAISSVQPEPGATKAIKHALAPSTFSGVRVVPDADVSVGAYLASGSFGSVYRGRWNNEDVALKQIDIAQAAKRLELSEQDVVEAIQWEVSRMSTVRHPNLVEFHGVCFKGDAIYLVMEFCTQGSLQKVLESLRAQQAVPVSRLWQWMLEIAEGLAYLHSQGVVHRDLKADNVLIDKHGRAKLADLGVAQVDALLEEKEAKPVQQGLQDKLFVAPESGGNASSKESDIYALGLVFWQMINGGKSPDSWDDLLVQDREFKSVKAGLRMPIPETCPEPIKELIQSCWQFKPDQRATSDQLIQKLREMGPKLHEEHGLVLLAEHMEQVLHGSREEIRNQVPPLVTRWPVEGSYETYWKAQAQLTTQPESQTTTTTTAATTTTTSTTTTTATPATASAMTSRTESTTRMKDADQSHANQALALDNIFDDFLAGSGPGSLLVLGEGGMGKSLSVRALAARIQQQWWQYFSDPHIHPRPAFLVLDLRSHVKSWTHGDLEYACADMIRRYQLQKAQSDLLVLVDGYDQCRGEEGSDNLARHLGLPRYAKLLITSRPDALTRTQWMQNFAWGEKPQHCYCLPLNASQLLDYLKKHLAWDDATHARYQAVVQDSADLRDLLGNPFLLYLLSQSWPTISKKSLQGLKRSDIYAGFIEHTVNAGSGLLSEEVRKQLQAGHADLVASFETFATGTALKALKWQELDGEISRTRKVDIAWAKLPELVRQEARRRYQRERAAHLHDPGEKGKQQHERRMVLTEAAFERMRMQAASQMMDALPLRARGRSWEFIDRSMFEYCAAQSLLMQVGTAPYLLPRGELRELLRVLVDWSPGVLMFVREAFEADNKRLVIHEKVDSELDRRGRRNAAALLHAIGKVLNAQGNDVEALKYFGLELLVLRTSQPCRGDLMLADAYSNFALMQYRMGNYHAALTNNCHLLAIVEAELGRISAYAAAIHHNIVRNLMELYEEKEAIKHYRRAGKNSESILGAAHATTCAIYRKMGDMLTAEADFKRATRYYNKALAAGTVLSPTHPFIVAVHGALSAVLRRQGKLKEALKEHRLAQAMPNKQPGKEHSKSEISNESSSEDYFVDYFQMAWPLYECIDEFEADTYIQAYSCADAMEDVTALAGTAEEIKNKASPSSTPVVPDGQTKLASKALTAPEVVPTQETQRKKTKNKASPSNSSVISYKTTKLASKALKAPKWVTTKGAQRSQSTTPQNDAQ